MKKKKELYAIVKYFWILFFVFRYKFNFRVILVHVYTGTCMYSTYKSKVFSMKHIITWYFKHLKFSNECKQV